MIRRLPCRWPTTPGSSRPWRSPADLSRKYRFIDKGTYDGQVYGIAINGNATGMVYNKAVWAQAGVTTWPTTPEEFLADLQTDQDEDLGGPAIIRSTTRAGR